MNINYKTNIIFTGGEQGTGVIQSSIHGEDNGTG